MSVRGDTSIRESFNKYDPEGGSLRPTGSRSRSGIDFQTDDGRVRAKPSDVINKFRQVDADRSGRYDDELPALPLPGTGGLRESCGSEVPRACADCGHVTAVGSTCYRARCPRCWKGWARRRAVTVTAKLEALRRYREASGSSTWDGWKFHHLVLSPPDGYAMNSKDVLQRTFEVLYEVLEEIGVDTGYLFYHPYRGPDDDDRGFWKSVLPDGDEIEPSEPFAEFDDRSRADNGTAELVDQYDLQHSPHFHGVVLSKFVQTEHIVEHVEEQTGWTIHRVTKGDDSDVSLYNDYDLARSTSYCLSHTGQGPNRVAYRPFGEVANFTVKESIKREMDARVRSVAVNTLGLEYSSEACVIEREKTTVRTVEQRSEKVNLGAAHGSGSPETEATADATADSSSPEMEEVEETTTETCEGRLVEARAFPALVNDREWMAEATYAQDIARAWRRWRDRQDDLPHPDPWDAPAE